MNGVSLSHENVEITFLREVKYLDIWLYNNLSFGEYIRKTQERSKRSLAPILRLVPKVEGARICYVIKKSVIPILQQ